MTDSLKNELILTRESKLGVSYLKLSEGGEEKVVLTDIKQETEFYLERSYFESLLGAGVFKVASQSEIDTFLGQLAKPQSTQDIHNKAEQKRRIKYVTGAIEAGIPLWIDGSVTPDLPCNLALRLILSNFLHDVVPVIIATALSVVSLFGCSSFTNLSYDSKRFLSKSEFQTLLSQTLMSSDTFIPNHIDRLGNWGERERG